MYLCATFGNYYYYYMNKRKLASAAAAPVMNRCGCISDRRATSAVDRWEFMTDGINPFPLAKSCLLLMRRDLTNDDSTLEMQSAEKKILKLI